jgi:hypothetical protein
VEVTIVYRGTPVAEGHLFRHPRDHAQWSGFVRPLAAGWPLVRDSVAAAAGPASPPPARDDPRAVLLAQSVLEGDAAAALARQFALAAELEAADARSGARLPASHVWLTVVPDGRVHATTVD